MVCYYGYMIIITTIIVATLTIITIYYHNVPFTIIVLVLPHSCISYHALYYCSTIRLFPLLLLLLVLRYIIVTLVAYYYLY